MKELYAMTDAEVMRRAAEIERRRDHDDAVLGRAAQLRAEAINRIAHRLDPVAFESYSGKPRAEKQRIEKQRKAARVEAEKLYERGER